MSKFASGGKGKGTNSIGANVASLDAARRARQVAAEMETKAKAQRDFNKLHAQQVHMPYPSDSPLGRAIENGLPASDFPRAKPDNVDPLTAKAVPAHLKPHVPQGLAGQE